MADKLWQSRKISTGPTLDPSQEGIGLLWGGTAGLFDPMQILGLQTQLVLAEADQYPVAGTDKPEQIRSVVLFQLPTDSSGGQPFTPAASPAFQNREQIRPPGLRAVGGQADGQFALGDVVGVTRYFGDDSARNEVGDQFLERAGVVVVRLGDSVPRKLVRRLGEFFERLPPECLGRRSALIDIHGSALVSATRRVVPAK